MKKENKEVVIYQGKTGEIKVSVDLQNETFLLTQQQVAEIFDVQKAAISKHIKNIFDTGELSKKATVSILETVQKEGKRTISRKVEYYNLDLVLSVGYRVNSAKATKFRIWATSVLKNYLLKGYAVNESRLLEAKSRFNELRETITFLKEKSEAENLKGQEKEILDLLGSYANTLTLLEKYDSGGLKEMKGGKPEFVLTVSEARNVATQVKKNLMEKKEAGELFGNEREGMFDGVIKNLYQTFSGKELYGGLATKASHLLYFVIKDHPFSDGNKRLGSFLFVYFLDRNNSLYRAGGEKKINDNALTALALLIAESRPEEKDQMVALVSQLLK
ncbi:MAG: virulence protein RhuM/Fic/DOC family protein [Candidatus Paceibacterota bacterium]|jgi:prophage maintenance system killer protein